MHEALTYRIVEIVNASTAMLNNINLSKCKRFVILLPQKQKFLASTTHSPDSLLPRLGKQPVQHDHKVVQHQPTAASLEGHMLKEQGQVAMISSLLLQSLPCQRLKEDQEEPTKLREIEGISSPSNE